MLLTQPIVARELEERGHLQELNVGLERNACLLLLQRLPVQKQALDFSSISVRGSSPHNAGEKEAITFNCSSRHEETGDNTCFIAVLINTHAAH